MTAPWTSSESTAAIIPAFVTALQTVEDVARNKKADIKTNAGQMRYNYADLDAVLEQAKPVLTANGLAVTQPAATDGVRTVLLHTSGEWLAFPPLQIQTAQSTPQAQGSALSYARRYSMLAVLGIATEDDDGKAAAQAPKATRGARQSAGTVTARMGTAAFVTDDNPGTPARPNQITQIQIRLKEIGITKRDNAVALYCTVIRRTVTSSKQLTVDEASQVIDVLDKIGGGVLTFVPLEDGTVDIREAS